MDNNTLYSQIYDLFREVPNTNTIASGVSSPASTANANSNYLYITIRENKTTKIEAKTLSFNNPKFYLITVF